AELERPGRSSRARLEAPPAQHPDHTQSRSQSRRATRVLRPRPSTLRTSCAVLPRQSIRLIPRRLDSRQPYSPRPAAIALLKAAGPRMARLWVKSVLATNTSPPKAMCRACEDPL